MFECSYGEIKCIWFNGPPRPEYYFVWKPEVSAWCVENLNYIPRVKPHIIFFFTREDYKKFNAVWSINFLTEVKIKSEMGWFERFWYKGFF
jgi:hypothetical protein